MSESTTRLAAASRATSFAAMAVPRLAAFDLWCALYRLNTDLTSVWNFFFIVNVHGSSGTLVFALACAFVSAFACTFACATAVLLLFDGTSALFVLDGVLDEEEGDSDDDDCVCDGDGDESVGDGLDCVRSTSMYTSSSS